MARRRKTLFVNKPFQLRFSFYVCSWIFALSFVYPLIIYSLFEFFIRYLRIYVPDQKGVALDAIQSEVIWRLIILQIVFLAITFLISLFLSHKIAGPLHKLSRAFKDAMDGKFGGNLSFRKSDHFRGLANEFNEMYSKLSRGGVVSDNLSSTISQVERVRSQMDDDGKKKLDDALNELRKIQS